MCMYTYTMYMYVHWFIVSPIPFSPPSPSPSYSFPYPLLRSHSLPSPPLPLPYLPHCRFLTAVAENASSSEDQDEGQPQTHPVSKHTVHSTLLPPDLSAPHMQLMLFVWHSFSVETRRVLLSQCAQAVVTVAKANEYAECMCYICTEIHVHIMLVIHVHVCVV